MTTSGVFHASGLPVSSKSLSTIDAQNQSQSTLNATAERRENIEANHPVVFDCTELRLTGTARRFTWLERLMCGAVLDPALCCLKMGRMRGNEMKALFEQGLDRRRPMGHAPRRLLGISSDTSEPIGGHEGGNKRCWNSEHARMVRTIVGRPVPRDETQTAHDEPERHGVVRISFECLSGERTPDVPRFSSDSSSERCLSGPL